MTKDFESLTRQRWLVKEQYVVTEYSGTTVFQFPMGKRRGTVNNELAEYIVRLHNNGIAPDDAPF